MNSHKTPILTLDTIVRPSVEGVTGYPDAWVEKPGSTHWICIEEACQLYPNLEGAQKVQGTVSMHRPPDGHWLLWVMDSGRLYLDGCDEAYPVHYWLQRWLIETVGMDEKFWATIEEVK